MQTEPYDVVIIGGGFAGSSTALLLKRRRPATRVLIVEKAEEFDRKVGESTTEVSSCFLTKVLGIGTYLGHHQLNKQGLRMWFARSEDEEFEECVELGARDNSRLSGFQVDRATLDEHVLKLAVEAGCDLYRPAKVTALEGLDGTERVLEVQRGDEKTRITAKWIVDASGRAAVVSRKLGLFRPLKEHPINALWGRFTGAKDWDGYELRAKHPRWAKAARTGRSWATNHLMGYGWWCWIIPLKGGDTSIGLVYDSRLFTPPEGATIAERIQAHLTTHPVGREILSEARVVEGDQRAYSALPYYSERVMGEGWALVGDAASFIDPLYSPGLDFCAFTAHAAQTLIARVLDGEEISGAMRSYNERFAFCYRAWFEGLYRDKYYYLGDAELMAAAFLLDISAYHLGPVRQVFSDPLAQFDALPFDGVPGRIVAGLMRFYNKRLARIAQRRRETGCYGARNAGWRMLVGGFLPDQTSGKLLLKGAARWLKAELQCLFMSGGEQPAASKAGSHIAEATQS